MVKSKIVKNKKSDYLIKLNSFGLFDIYFRDNKEPDYVAFYTEKEAKTYLNHILKHYVPTHREYYEV